MSKITVLYARLSQDDELQGPSNSIVNQQQLLEDYAERHVLTPYVHIEDDGYSGTRWDRPGWQELITKVEAGEVACICIKDGSRLGRDYLRVGLYRELFCEKGVRLIAINDNYDSANGEDDLLRRAYRRHLNLIRIVDSAGAARLTSPLMSCSAEESKRRRVKLSKRSDCLNLRWHTERFRRMICSRWQRNRAFPQRR